MVMQSGSCALVNNYLYKESLMQPMITVIISAERYRKTDGKGNGEEG